ncbi:MAG: conjugal transfer protein TrbE [Termitinemataceae bacterium]|nr:MAG: conjugal transfer protein TrbE [Termitinemataceae bacterium]
MSVDKFYIHLPWAYISTYHAGVVVQKDGILQRTIAFEPPDLDTSSEAMINDLSVRLNNCIKRLGAGWAVQFEAQRYCTQDYPGAEFNLLAPFLIDRERELAFKNYGAHFESSYYLTFIYKPPSEVLQKAKDIFVQSNSANTVSSERDNVMTFVNESNDIINIIGNQMGVQALNNQQTVEFLHSSISMNRHEIYFPTNAILLDKILPDQVLHLDLTMRLGEAYIPIVGINDFPNETYPTILSRLNETLLEYRWVTRFICLDKEAALKVTQKAEKMHRGNRQTALQSFMSALSGEPSKSTNRGVELKEADASAAGAEIETDDVGLGYYSSDIMVWDESYKLSLKKADKVKSIVNSAGFTAKLEAYNALEAFKSMMPGNVHSNYHSVPVTTDTLSHVIPLSSIWVGMKDNKHAGEISGVSIPHLICSTLSGTPFFLNTTVNDVGHTTIFGPTGAGKSTLLNLLEMQFFKYPDSQVIVFDKGKSCRQPCMACGGLFYEPASDNKNGVAFQPLRELETDSDKLFAVEFIETLLSLQGVRVIPSMTKSISEAIGLLSDIKEKERRTLTTFVQNVNYYDPQTNRDIIKENMLPYLYEGTYGKIFDVDVSDISLDNRFIAFEMEALMNLGIKCVAPALSYLFYFVEKKFTGKLTMLVLDEAWIFLQHDYFKHKIAEWLKVLRKKNVYVVFATQNVDDAANSEISTTIIQQCLTKIYLADPQATGAMCPAYEKFNLSAAEIETLAAAEMKRDYLYTSPIGTRLFQLQLGELTLALIGGTDHAKLDELQELHPDAGYEFCEDIFRSKNIEWKHLMDKSK